MRIKKAYEFNSPQEKQTLIKTFGADYFKFIPSASRGYLFEKNDSGVGGWASSFPTDREVVSFQDVLKSLSKEKNVTLKGQIAYAQSLLGETITSRDGCYTGKVEKYEIVDHNTFEWGRDQRKASEKLLDEQAVIVVLFGTWDSIKYNTWTKNKAGEKFAQLAHPTLWVSPIAKKPIFVNGREAKDCGAHWEFGCAKISKQVIRQADAFLNLANSTAESNRKIAGIKIGEGFFTVDIIAQLAKL